MTNREGQQSPSPKGNLLDRLGSRLFRGGLAVALAIFVLDQLTKWAIWHGLLLNPHKAIPIFPGFNLIKVCNYGVSFGGLHWLGPWFLSGLAIVISAALVVWLRRAETRLLAVALGSIIGGAIGNVIDRIAMGCVADFLDFYIPGTDWPHWPAFNIADSAIVVGVGLIILDGLFAERNKNA